MIRSARTVFAYAWAGPNTLLGLLIGLVNVAAGGRTRVVEGVLEVHGPVTRLVLRRLAPAPGGALALTLGHVVLGWSAAALDVTRRHERVHVGQYERWGPLFIPAYFAASGLAYLRGRHPYRDNRFEAEAYGIDG